MRSTNRNIRMKERRVGYRKKEQTGCFDSPEFKAALKFAATLPETTEAYGDGEYTVYPQGYMYDSRCIEDQVLLQPVVITRVRDLCARINGALGELNLNQSFVRLPMLRKRSCPGIPTGVEYALV